MRRRLSQRPSAGFVVAFLALFVALGGTTVAKVLISGSEIRDGTITGADIKNRTLGAAKLKLNSLTGAEIKESSLSKIPNAVNADTVGGKAPSAFQPAGHWMLIAGTGAGAGVLAQSGRASVQRFVAGVYLVGVGASAVGKSLSATLNDASPGFITVAPCGGSQDNPGGVTCPLANDNSHVIVRTMNQNGTPTDSTFYLSVGG